MGLGGTVAMSLITGCYIDLIYRANTSSCGPEQLKDGPQMERGSSGAVVWEQLEQQRLIVTALPKKKKKKNLLASRLKLLTRLSIDVNEETPGLIRSLKAQVQTYRVGMRPCTSCDSGAGIKLSARPIFKALIFLCQMPEPLQTRLMERQWERGGGKKKTRQLAKLVQLQTEWGDSLYA